MSLTVKMLRVQNIFKKSLVERNSRQNIRELAKMLNTSESTRCQHLEKIGKTIEVVIWVPHALSVKNRVDRLSSTTILLSKQRNKLFHKYIKTCDEEWNNVQLKGFSIDINLHKQVEEPSSMLKRCYLRVGRSSSIIRLVFLKHYEILNALLFIQQLKCVHKDLVVKRPALIVLHDDAK